ncbi:MAG: hypothetical protein IT378_02680 [Sandaracinaceae bacterium]|nr:hypothetical protein [Sandaracinaceae bacterium]
MTSSGLEVAIAYDLKAEIERRAKEAGIVSDDALEEYDSESTVAAIQDALRKNGHRTRLIGGGRPLLERVLKHRSQLVFNIAEGGGTRSREAHVPAVLEMLGIPYTHSDPLTLSLTLDKGLAKRVVASCGVPTPPFAVVERVEQVRELGLEYPLIAKPIAEGSSLGVRDSSRADTPEQLEALLASLLPVYRQPVLVEEFCSGAELTVGILGTGADAEVIGTMEIVPRHGAAEDFIYSLEVKRDWRNRVDYHAPPKRDPDLIREVGAVALASYRALGCRDVGRVDVRLDRRGRPCFLEVNPLPGLNPISGDLVILARGHGISYEELIGRIVERARARQGL